MRYRPLLAGTLSAHELLDLAEVDLDSEYKPHKLFDYVRFTHYNTADKLKINNSFIA